MKVMGQVVGVTVGGMGVIGGIVLGEPVGVGGTGVFVEVKVGVGVCVGVEVEVMVGGVGVGDTVGDGHAAVVTTVRHQPLSRYPT